MPPHQIIAQGTTENSPEGVYMTDFNKGKKLLWVAKRGEVHDWAIYIFWEEAGIHHVLAQGDKVTMPYHIKKLVPCDEEAFKMYRL